MQIVTNAIDFLRKLYIAMYSLYDTFIVNLQTPLSELLDEWGVFGDILTEILDIVVIWGGADVTIFELIVGSLLPSMLITIVVSWFWNTFKKILPL